MYIYHFVYTELCIVSSILLNNLQTDEFAHAHSIFTTSQQMADTQAQTAPSGSENPQQFTAPKAEVSCIWYVK